MTLRNGAPHTGKVTRMRNLIFKNFERKMELFHDIVTKTEDINPVSQIGTTALDRFCLGWLYDGSFLHERMDLEDPCWDNHKRYLDALLLCGARINLGKSLPDSGIEVPRHWTVVSIPNLPEGETYWPDELTRELTRKYYVSERFGIHRGEDGCVKRDLIFNTDILLGVRRFDYCPISSEDYISFMKTLLSGKDIQKFLRAYLFGFIIGNNNMHVNNFSVRYAGSGYALMPIYGMASYKSLYQHEADIALPVSGKSKVTSKAFAKLMLDSGLPRNDIAEMREMVMDNLDSTASEYIDMDNDKEQLIYTEIRKYAESRCKKMARCIASKKHSREHNEQQSLDR